MQRAAADNPEISCCWMWLEAVHVDRIGCAENVVQPATGTTRAVSHAMALRDKGHTPSAEKTVPLLYRCVGGLLLRAIARSRGGICDLAGVERAGSIEVQRICKVAGFCGRIYV